MWLKVELENVTEVPSSLKANMLDRVCLIKVEVFLTFKVLIRVFQGFPPGVSSSGAAVDLLRRKA